MSSDNSTDSPKEKKPLDFNRAKLNRDIDKILGTVKKKEQESENDKRKKRLEQERAERAAANERIIRSYNLRGPGTGT